MAETKKSDKKAKGHKPKSYKGLRKVHILGRVAYVPNRGGHKKKSSKSAA